MPTDEANEEDTKSCGSGAPLDQLGTYKPSKLCNHLVSTVLDHMQTSYWIN